MKYLTPNRLIASLAILIAAGAGLLVAGRGARGEDATGLAPPPLVRSDVSAPGVPDTGPTDVGFQFDFGSFVGPQNDPTKDVPEQRPDIPAPEVGPRPVEVAPEPDPPKPVAPTPPPIPLWKLDPAGWEASLVEREKALAEATLALERQQKQLEALWSEARQAQRFAAKMCDGPISPGGARAVLPGPLGDDMAIAGVVAVIKKMKPTRAAEVIQSWDDFLTVAVMQRLSARSSAPILASAPPKYSARITRRMASGRSPLETSPGTTEAAP